MRSIFKLLSANLRHKKGAFTGIVILMAIVTLSYAVTLSNNRNLEKAVDESFSAQQIGDWVFQLEASPSQEIMDVLHSHPEITGTHEEHFIRVDAPVLADGEESLDLTVLRCGRDTDQLFNEAGNGLADYRPPRQGEVYLSYKLCSRRLKGFAVGKEIQIKTHNGYDETFTVRGYYQDVVDNTVGTALLCQEDYDRLHEKCDGLYDLNRMIFSGTKFHVNVKDGTDLRALEKTLKKECNLFQNALAVNTKEELRETVMIFASTGTRIVAVFTVLLVMIVMIVIGSSIGTAVETEYVNLGVLKAVGFDKGHLRAVWALQYSLAVLLGSALGLLAAIPVTSAMGMLFKSLSKILTSNRLALGRCALAAFLILLVCMVYVIFATAKVGRISPVRAISGGHSEIYFDNLLQMPIRKRGLHFFVALRQFTSRFKSYFGSMMIVALLVFFLCTIMIFTGGINADLFMAPTGDIEMNLLSGALTKEHMPELEKLCRRYDPDADILLYTGRYTYAEDEKILLQIYSSESLFTSPLEGRLPEYDNEITVTELFAKKVQKQIGDSVTVQFGEKQADFIITGLIQSVMSISSSGVLEMTADGGSRLGIDALDYGYVRLSDLSQKTALTNALNEEMSEYLSAREFEPGAYMADIIDMVNLVMQIIIFAVYGVSLVFAAVVVTMICRRVFLRERTDLGIFRALGFSVPSLRLQFALRFLLIAVVGSAAGCLAALLGTGRLLSLLMQMIGISRFGADFTWKTLLLPSAAVSAAFFVCTYLTSRRVRKVSVRELVTE